MKKEDLLKLIAKKAYDVGFGAKKHFATFDIVDKVPNYISFFAICFGIFSLVFKVLSAQGFSVLITILGFVGYSVNFYSDTRGRYDDVGRDLTDKYHELHNLYLKTKSATDTEIKEYYKEYECIEKNCYEKVIGKQILGSHWYAHYKFFWEQQVDWINQELSLKLFRDKLPLSFTILISTILVVIVFCLVVTALFFLFCIFLPESIFLPERIPYLFPTFLHCK